MIVGKAAKSNIFWFLSNKEPSNEAILLGVSSTKMLFTNCLLLCLHSVLLLAYTPTKDIKTSQYISIASNLFAMMKTTIGTGYSIIQYITMYFYFLTARCNLLQILQVLVMGIFSIIVTYQLI